MKNSKGRLLKVISLVAMLAACMLLTGCVVPPDDIGANGGYVVTDNDPPFQQLGPQVTFTPYVAQVTTNTPEPTKNWLVPDQATPTPTVNPILPSVSTNPLQNLVSITPQVIINTSTATPQTNATSLKVGSTGAEVRKMQNRLKELGYLKGSADGDFGAATEAAVKSFQAQNGLAVDGKAGTATLNKLYSANAKKAPANVTNTPKPTAKPTKTPKVTATPKAESLDYYLENGASGTKVRTLQNRLIELGWLSGQADGKYGNATEYAVKAFQKRYSSLWDDGVAGPDTLKQLYGAGAATAKTPAASLGQTLSSGDEGAAVKALQNRLKELGFYKKTIDGEYGSTTKAAVTAFQAANGLSETGKANETTLNKLYSASAKDADYLTDEENAKNEEDEEETGNQTDSDKVEVNGYTTLQWGDTGTAVKKLQEALKNRGSYSGKIDSTFGSGVYAAVKAFQKQYGLKADGIAGPATQNLLFNTSASSSDTSTSLQKGSSGTEVRNLQYVLAELGYYDGSINGEYGNTTADAVRAFQINNDISPVDGVAGPKTLKVIYSSKAVGATASSGSYDTLSKGDKGTAVVEMQEKLKKLGYLSEVTGEFDTATVEAVKNFQRRNNLTVNGKANSSTLSKLYSKSANPAW